MQTQLFVTDSGELSNLTWVVDCPIFINNDKNISEAEYKELERFRGRVIDLFQEYSENKVYADYDFETYDDED